MGESEQEQECLTWVLWSFVHLHLDSMAQHTFLDSLSCARSGLSPAQVSVPVWRWTRGKGSCAPVQVRGDRDPPQPSALGVSTGLDATGWLMPFRLTQAHRPKSLGDCDEGVEAALRNCMS